MSEMQEALKEFVVESHENLDQLDTDLVGLEKSAAPTEALGRIFRTLHTIKGSCSFLGFPHLESTAHAGENLLGKLRDGKTELSPAVTAALLRVVDAIRKMLASIEHEGHDGQSEDRALIDELNRLATAAPAPSPTVRPAAAESAVNSRTPDVSFVAGKPSDIAEPMARDATQDTVAGAGAGESAAIDTSAVYDASVRIHVDLLNKLMRVAGEIVLARNQILQYGQKYEDPAFQNTCRQLNLITTELQEYVMKTRLQPIGNVWNRFPRLVHDTAQACGKRVRLEIDGSETELDKTLLEAIRDPLTHLVRNAIDHGIESPLRRLELGKPEEGCVRLRAYHEGGQVIVECSDDGHGIEPERVKSRAIEQNLITAEQAAKMGTQTILGLIFEPGFSTARAVTTLSGRGVGMDVVKTNIERIGGSVDLHSPVGQGTTVRIRIPLTLAIIKVLVVKSGNERYAIPQVSLLELVRLEGDQARQGIELIHDAPVYRLRGNLLPLVYLRQQLQLDSAASRDRGAPAANGDGVLNIVVLQADGRQFGLVVDSIGDTEEIVVKPLQKQLKGINAFAGATIMGDGKVALILDVLGLAQRARVVRGARDRSVPEKEAAPPEPSAALETVLLFNTDDRARMAIPLVMVDRLEEFRRSAVERVGAQDVVQYRENILPLVDVACLWGAAGGPNQEDDSPMSLRAETDVRTNGRKMLQVIVVASQGRRAGLVVERIVDIAEEAVVARSEAYRPLVLYTAVIQGRVTEVLDVEQIVRRIQPAHAETSLTVAAGT
jgi:two-component system, chemotaxis family, sensor kinase CheA